MEAFRNYLKQDYLKRAKKNPSYSLRAYAKHLKIDHSALSAMLSGKRTITKKTLERISNTLGLHPVEIKNFLLEQNLNAESTVTPYHLIQEDTFTLMSDWTFDAIMELSNIQGVKITPETVAAVFSMTPLQAKLSIETLERAGFLIRNKKGELQQTHENTTNILDPNFSSVAQRKYQKSVLEKSIEALENVARTERDHTSTIMAVARECLPEVKKLIAQFRKDLNAYASNNKKHKPNEVYQLHVGFFPVSSIKNLKK